jgi:hypothetical protein
MAERRPTLTASARAGVRNLRSGRKKACGAVEQKKAQKLRKKASTEIGLDSAPAHIIPIALAASQCPTSRDFVPWRFSAAARSSAWRGCACRRLKTLYGALEVKQRIHAFYFSFNPISLFDLKPISSSRPAASKRCRAQGLSRLAVAQISVHAPAMPGRTLTAPSTAARSL